MDIIGKRRWFYILSALVILAGIVSLAIPPSLRAGIEFTSGSAMEITFVRPVTEGEIRDQMTALGHPEAIIQKMGDNAVLIRTMRLKPAEQDSQGNVITPAEHIKIGEALAANVAPIVGTPAFTDVSPIVARETVRNAAIAVAVAAVAILVYITWAFRRVPKSFRYGVSATVALAHDILVLIGIYSILGRFMNLEISSMFIVGILTLVGYSVNDTIVVFDRLRENVARNVERPLWQVVNESILQTMGRSLNTGITTLIVLLALLMLGGATIQPLIVLFVIGIITGTYSSIFVASALLVSWESGDFRKALRFLRLAPARS